MTSAAISDQQLIEMGKAAQVASRQLSRHSTQAIQARNRALIKIAEALEGDQSAVLEANRRDCQQAKAHGMDPAMLDRLLLTPDRLAGTAQEVRNVAALPDPVGQIIETTTRPNGLVMEKRRVPLGVIGSIYESRPNVTVDIASLCLKSGNACLLRGGKESLESNTALVTLIKQALAQAGLPPDAVQFVDNPDRALVDTMLAMKKYINLLIPRGGSGLVNFVGEHATMPVVTGGVGVCHTYVDRAADLTKARKIIFNAKVQRPTVCNALDTVLLHAEIAPVCLPVIAEELSQAGVELRCDHRAISVLGPDHGLKVLPATPEDWGQEFLSLIAAVKVVDSLDEALEHIESYGSGHSEAIITEDSSSAERFLDDVDAAAVYVNASTRFTDGSQFGLGAEVGISTQKFHARGPMGLTELTSYKWVIRGSGQIRE